MNTVAKQLQTILKLTGYSQEQLAQVLQVSFVTLNSWINERSQPRRRAQEKILDLYNEYTGEKTVSEEVLDHMRRKLHIQSTFHTNILQLLASRVDLKDQFVLSLTYHSNSIEGSTFTEQETAQVLFENRQLPNKNLWEVLEAKNHQTAFEYMLKFAQMNKSITEEYILRLHAILMNSIRDDAGCYRNHGVRIVGANIPTANHLKVPTLMSTLVEKINTTDEPITKHVSMIHAIFEKIHPFSDGNGRVGRLLLNTMLLQQDYPPALIQQERKQLYYTYLNKAQRIEDYSLLEKFICEAIALGFEVVEEDGG